MDKRSDVEVMVYYRNGRVRNPDDDREQTRRLKDVGYLSCTVDITTGEEYLKTTELGLMEVDLNNSLDKEHDERLLYNIRKISWF
ncbi:MAG: hypothetical protein Q4Q58_07200 [Thermoplasmata archaeon]|nr:hypothetical protein [Thermoplasmata archaeon]